VSRGFADYQYKADDSLKQGEQKVSCVPDLYQMKDMEEGDFVLL